MKERDIKVHDTHISEGADQKKMDTMKIKKNITTKDDKKMEQTNKISEATVPTPINKETKKQEAEQKEQQPPTRKIVQRQFSPKKQEPKQVKTPGKTQDTRSVHVPRKEQTQRYSNQQVRRQDTRTDRRVQPELKSKPLEELSLTELNDYARRLGIVGARLINREVLIKKIQYVEEHPELEMEVEGVLEKLPDGFGFLR